MALLIITLIIVFIVGVAWGMGIMNLLINSKLREDATQKAVMGVLDHD